ncbi:MAG: hypothetical protein U1C56_01325, partial [Candidatus Curtissbacteria bacterium]|nr:hypothetical protein [Candidatus Curtissbacteria bacterium]
KLKKELGGENNQKTLKLILKQFAESRKNIPGDRHKNKAHAGEEFRNRQPNAQEKRQAISKTNGKCAYPGCNKPHDHLHHPDYFGHGRNHDKLQPLCRVHHEFMHNGLIAFQSQPPENWKLSLAVPDNYYDSMYRKYKNG